MLVAKVNALVDGLNQTESYLNEEIVSKPADYQTEWLKNLGGILTDWYDTENFSQMMQCKILLKVWLIWDRDHNEFNVALREEAKNPWEGDFYQWARAYTRSRSEEPSDTTIWNKISTYRDWVGIDLKIDEEKRLTLKPTIEYSEDFQPEFVDYSKLLIARGSARRGELDEAAWEALQDPTVTCTRLKKFLPNVQSNGSESTFRFFHEDGVIKVYEDGHVEELFMVLLENSGNPLFNKGAGRIFKAAGLEIPEYLRNST